MIDYKSCQGFEHGYPASAPREFYGAWAPAFDCFIFVHYDLDRMIKMQWLLSSKVLIHIYRFDHTVMELNLIDNLCCENWTISREQQIKIALAYKNGGTADQCQLIPKNQHDLTVVDDLKFIRTWSFFLNHWCQVINGHNPLQTCVSNFIDPSQTNLLYRTLWLGRDIEQTTKVLNETNISG